MIFVVAVSLFEWFQTWDIWAWIFLGAPGRSVGWSVVGGGGRSVERRLAVDRSVRSVGWWGSVVRPGVRWGGGGWSIRSVVERSVDRSVGWSAGSVDR